VIFGHVAINENEPFSDLKLKKTIDLESISNLDLELIDGMTEPIEN